MKLMAEFLWLIRQLLNVIKSEKRAANEERIKNDPSGVWGDRFGRVQHNSAEAELPTDDPSATSTEYRRDSDAGADKSA